MLRRRAIATVFCVMVALGTQARASALGGFRISDQIALTAEGASLTLQVLADSRITPALAGELWQEPADQIIATQARPGLVESLDRRPFLPARLRLLGADGSILGQAQLGGPVAKLKRLKLSERPAGDSDAQVVAVTVADPSQSEGYTGTITTLYQVGPSVLKELAATDESGRQAPITLRASVKSAWQASPKSTPFEIRQVICRPDFDAATPASDALPFKVSYISYRLVNGAWQKEQRTGKGFWEDDQAFPVAEKFP